MVKGSYTPEQGDIVWLTFSPQIGHEQAGRRPALILSPRSYNELVGMAIACPITSKAKGYPFEVRIESKKISGVILVDQIRSLDWKGRKAALIQSIEEKIISEVVAKLSTLLPKGI
jgi:mRNA interferase MazF